MIRILIADDHLVVRDGLRTMLEIHPDMAVLGATSRAEAIARAMAAGLIAGPRAVR